MPKQNQGMSISLLVPIYMGILVITLVYSAMLWFKTKQQLYKFQFVAFLCFTVTLTLQGISAESAYIWRALAISTVFFGLTALAKLITLIQHKKHFPFRKYCLIYAAGVLATVGLNVMNVDTNWMLFPSILGATFPMFMTGYQELVLGERKPSFLTKWFIGSGIFYSAHLLDYAYTVDKPEYMYVGFLIACLSIFSFVLFSNAAVIETLMLENANFRMQMQYKVMLTNTSKLASLGEMAGGMAHEINNPLTTIQLQSDMLKKSLHADKIDKEVAIKRLTVVTDALQRISKVISNLKQFSRDTSEDPIDSVPIKDVVDQTLSFCKVRFADQGIQIGDDAIPDFKIKCRPMQLSQAMLNLLNNSFESLSRNGNTEKIINILVEKSYKEALIRIVDNGQGIPGDIRDKIFDPFFTTKEVGEGMGLGLNVSLGMIAAQNGTLELDAGSEKTCFLIKLPLG